MPNQINEHFDTCSINKKNPLPSPEDWRFDENESSWMICSLSNNRFNKLLISTIQSTQWQFHNFQFPSTCLSVKRQKMRENDFR